MSLSGNIYKGIADLLAITLFAIAAPLYRQRQGRELTKSEKDRIFKKSYAFAISALIIALALLFYLNNRPW